MEPVVLGLEGAFAFFGGRVPPAAVAGCAGCWAWRARSRSSGACPRASRPRPSVAFEALDDRSPVRGARVALDEVYVDHAGHFGQCLGPEGKRTRTIIGTALEKLGVEVILANSPQAKGRVERTFGTAQDRLVKEMRLARVTTLEAANRYLEERWVPFWNERFTVAPADPLDAHRPLPPDTDLEALFAETDTRVVARDFTVRFENRFWQVTARDAEAAGVAPGSPVVVERRLSGELRFRHRGCYLTPTALGAVRSATPKPAPAPATAKAQAQAAEAGKESPVAQALQRQRGPGRGQAGTPRRPLQRDRSRAVQDLVLSPQAGTAARTPLPAKVGRDRSVGIRASEACRRCAGCSAHHDPPSWQAQCELRAIGAAVSGPVRVGVHPARAWPRRRPRLARPPLASKRPEQGARRRPAQACWIRASCANTWPPASGRTHRPHHQGGHFYFGQIPDISTLA